MAKLSQENTKILKMFGLVAILVFAVVAIGLIQTYTGEATFLGNLFKKKSEAPVVPTKIPSIIPAEKRGITTPGSNFKITSTQAEFDAGNGLKIIKAGDFKNLKDLPSTIQASEEINDILARMKVDLEFAGLKMENFKGGIDIISPLGITSPEDPRQGTRESKQCTKCETCTYSCDTDANGNVVCGQKTCTSACC